MLHLLHLFFKHVVAGHVLKLLSLEFFAAMAIAAAAAAARSQDVAAGGPDVPLAEFAKVLSTYSALGMTACLTTMALATRWASGDFGAYFRERAAGVERIADYSALLFKLSWTAFTHWAALLAGLVGSLLVPKDWSLLEPGGGIAAAWCGAASVFLFSYCIMLFLSVLLGVSVLCMIRKDFMEGGGAPR